MTVRAEKTATAVVTGKILLQIGDADPHQIGELEIPLHTHTPPRGVSSLRVDTEALKDAGRFNTHLIRLQQAQHALTELKKWRAKFIVDARDKGNATFPQLAQSLNIGANAARNWYLEAKEQAMQEEKEMQ